MSLFHPLRSICLACGAPISWHDNLPILSYLWLRGRCRRCGAPIGRRTLVLEIATPLIALGIYGTWGAGTPAGSAALAASWSLVTGAIVREKRKLRGAWVLVGVVLWAFFVGVAALALGPGN